MICWYYIVHSDSAITLSNIKEKCMLPTFEKNDIDTNHQIIILKKDRSVSIQGYCIADSKIKKNTKDVQIHKDYNMNKYVIPLKSVKIFQKTIPISCIFKTPSLKNKLLSYIKKYMFFSIIPDDVCIVLLGYVKRMI